jgi:hypothetical protein
MLVSFKIYCLELLSGTNPNVIDSNQDEQQISKDSSKTDVTVSVADARFHVT